MLNKKIGILGSGAVAKALAKGFLQNDCEVMLGTRDASKLKDFNEQNGNKYKIGSFEQTAQFGEIIVLAVKGTVAKTVIEQSSIQNLNGKTVIDTTNPIAELPPVNGVIQLFTGPNDSLMEQLQKNFSEINFVKAFSCVGNALMVNPDFSGLKPTMFICGNNEAAKQSVTEILTTFNWETEDMGKVESARAIEPLVVLWCLPGFLRNQWTQAFKMLKK
ncbi:DNA-binding protein [Bacteroidota bacterium]|nr:DNA-binding protein [Bacteroidota bacterium]